MYEYASARSVDFTDIPCISVAESIASGGKAELGRELVSAARQVGFFYLCDHGIDAGLRDGAFAASAEFFALDETRKAAVAVDKNQRGWMAQGVTRLEGSAAADAKEVFFWGREPDEVQLAEKLALVAPNRWPDETAPFLRTAVTPYYEQVMAVGDLALSALAEGLGKDADFFTPFYRQGLGRGQLVCYPPSGTADAEAMRFGAAGHTDFGVLTLLSQDDLGGLQVQNRSGDWIEAPPVKDSLVCNIGDLLERWTNGILVSTRHRVINRSGKTRYSIPIFHDPSSDAVIDPADFAHDGMPIRFEPVQAGAYIVSRNRKNFLHYNE
ncbi:MAG: hypothetical protein OXF29_09065 [Hyphomicrobiales bacterium]|nr:hypothetical protein [Hyphomicrobiales bacterium]